ncbi:MAG: hypothetical protein ACXAE3_05055 [Candidatus Kariarchaeaceae archaeon]|jgi:hypothetical protein
MSDDRFDRYGRIFYLIIFLVAIFYIITTTVGQSTGDPFEALRRILDGESITSVSPLISPILLLAGLSVLFVVFAIIYRRRS